MSPSGSARDYLDGQRALQTALTSQLGVDRDELRRNQRLLWTWDSLSLALCLRWQPFALTDVPARNARLRLTLTATAAESFTIDPWPFAGQRVEVRCEGRRLAGRFDTQARLHQELEQAPVVALVFTLEASSP